MSAILEAAQLQGNASIIRRAWAKRGKQKVHGAVNRGGNSSAPHGGGRVQAAGKAA